MPQGDQKDLKARVALKEKILKLTKDLQKVEADIAKSIETQGTASDDLVAKHEAAKKALDKSQKDFVKGSKKTEEATKSNVEVAKEWGDALIDKVGKAQKDAEKNQKSLSKSFSDSTLAIADMGKQIITATRDEGTAKLLEGFNNVNMQVDQMVEGITEFSDDKMAELLEQQQEYNKKLMTSTKLTYKQKDTIAKIRNTTKDAAKGMSEAAAKGGKFAEHLTTSKGRANILAVAISAVGAAFEKVLGTAIKFQESLGTSSKTSMEMAFSWNKILQKMIGIGEPLSDARMQLALAASDITMMGDSGKQLTRNMTWVARETGASAKSLAEMQEIMMLTTDLSREQAGLMIMGLEGFVTAAGGIPKEVFEDISSSAEEIAKWTNGSADAIARAATMANKLGINLKTAGSMADSLLNLESSIAAEFEASVLIGRELNLDKARTLALNNDLEGVMKEIVSQVGSEAEFQAMNAIERQSLAAAVGVSTEDLSKMIGYGADGGGEVDPNLKIAKQSNKGIWEIVTQLTPGRMKGLVGMLTKGLTALIGYKAMKAGVKGGLKAMGVSAKGFTSGFTKGIADGIKNSSIVKWFRGTSTWFGKTSKVWNKFPKFFGPMSKLFGKLFGVLTIIIDAFRGISKFFGIGSDKTGEERETEKKQGAGILIGGIIGGALGSLGGPVGIGIGAGIGAWIGEKMATMQMPPGFAQAFKNWFAGVWGAVKPLVDRITALFGKFSDIFASEGTMSEKIGKALGELVLALPGILWEGLLMLTGLVISTFGLLWDILPDLAVMLWEVVKSMGDTILSGIWAGLVGIKDSMFEFGAALFSTLWNGLLEGLNSVIAKMKSIKVFGYEPFKHFELFDIDKAASSDTANDFVWRSGQGIQKFSKDDNLLGMKDLSMLSQAGSGAASAAELEKQLTILTAINENLAPLAALVISNEGIKTAIENNKTVAGD